MKGGWAAIPNRIARDPNLHYAAKALFMALASHADNRGAAFPSVTTLAAETGMSEASVKRYLGALRDTGLIGWEVRSTPRGRQRFYTVWQPGDEVITPGGSDHQRPDPSDHQRPPNKNQENKNQETTTPLPPAPTQLALVGADEVERVEPYEVEFDGFWKCWPDSRRRLAALKAYRAVRRRGVPMQVIADGLRAHMPWLLAKIANDERQYIPHAATWLNQELYLEQPPPMPRYRGDPWADNAPSTGHDVFGPLTQPANIGGTA